MVDAAIRIRMKLLFGTGASIRTSPIMHSGNSNRCEEEKKDRVTGNVNECSEACVAPSIPAPDEDRHENQEKYAMAVVSRKKRKGKGSPTHCQYERELKKKKLLIEKLNQCCKKQSCYKKFDLASIKMCREQVHCLPHVVDRRAIVLSQFVKVKKNGEESSKLKPTIDGIKVCHKFFCYAFAITNDFVYRLLKFGIHQTPSVHQSRKLMNLLVWFDQIKELGEQQPNSTHVLLPYRTRLQLFTIYQADHPRGDHNDSCSFTYFKYVLAQHRPDLKLRKYMTFSKCDHCIRLRESKTKTQDASVYYTSIHYSYTNAQKIIYIQCSHFKKCSIITIDSPHVHV
jgi:hypothetical protein